MPTQKSRSTKKSSPSLPGAKLVDQFQVAKKQTQGLLDQSKKKLATAKVGEQNHAKKFKLAEDKLKKHESTHKNKPSKSSSKNIVSAKKNLKKVGDLHKKSQTLHKQAKDHHNEHQNHYEKLNHLHTAVQDAHKNWNSKKR